jgi:hypothetical protein
LKLPSEELEEAFFFFSNLSFLGGDRDFIAFYFLTGFTSSSELLSSEEDYYFF